MNDLISRQAAIEHWQLIIDATSTDSGYNMGFVDGLEFCISHLSTMPSAQPEIIRCKDCKHSRFFDPCFYCYEMGGEIIVPENGFCFKAERREDG